MEEDTVNLPRNVLWELARLRQLEPVCPESVNYKLNEHNQAVISFDIKTDILLESIEKDILDKEPIIFQYPNQDLIGQCAPQVFSGRNDFPRNFLHLNPTSLNAPVSLCLARAGNQSIYNKSGVAGVIERLGEWLNDAKTETLYEDGWEPVPYLINQKYSVAGYLDIEKLQHHASSQPDGGYGLTIADIRYFDQDSVIVSINLPLLDTANPGQIQYANDKIQNSNQFDKFNLLFDTSIPVVFVWPSRNNIELDPKYSRWCEISSLQEGIKETGLFDHVENAYALVDHYFSKHLEGGQYADTDLRGNYAFILVVGLWRISPIEKSYVGYASENEPRSLEIRAFYLRRPSEEEDRWSNQTDVIHFLDIVPINSSILETVSGEPALESSVLLGVGALGSAFADYAVRSGTVQLTVVDKDIFLSHNIARHRGNLCSVGKRKSEVVENLAELCLPKVTIKRYDTNIVKTDDYSLASCFVCARYVIDATADPLVRRRLSRIKSPNLPVLRSEIFHKGKLGVSLLSELGTTQNLNCLFFQLLALATENNSIYEWLTYECSEEFHDEELLLGYSCSSLTTKMSAYRVDSHASNAFAFAKSKLPNFNQPLILLHKLNDDGLTRGTEVICPDPVRSFQTNTTNGWCVIVTEKVLEKIHRLRQLATPIETGGYLYGAVDEAANEIYIVAASPEPPNSVASSTNLKLTKWGQTEFEKKFLKRTRSRLLPIGTWHSHTSSNSAASPIDENLFIRCKQKDWQLGVPTVMVITAVSGDSFYVAS